jgi:hypothetical protein
MYTSDYNIVLEQIVSSTCPKGIPTVRNLCVHHDHMSDLNLDDKATLLRRSS